MKIKININGRTYNSPDEVPPELRSFLDKDGDGVLDVLQENFKGGDEEAKVKVATKTYHLGKKGLGSGEALPDEVKDLLADKDGDGVPDVLQKQGGASPVRVTTRVSRTWTVNGKTYHSLEEMPAEARAALQKIKLGNTQSPSERISSSDPLDPDHRGLRDPIRPESSFPLWSWIKRRFRKR